jgi:hypothetical protein
MHQDFSDLGIEIETHQEEEMSFAIYNNYIKKYQIHNLDGNSSISSSTTTPLSPQNITASPSTKPITSPPSENSRTPDKKPSANLASPNKPIPPTNLINKFVSVTDNPALQPSVIDKPITLKNKETRRHVHRYDLRIGIKECHSEEEEQKLLQGQLEEFLDTMLSADRSILVPPYYELDQSNPSFQDLSSTFKITEVESFTKLKRYFSRLGNRNPNMGFVYCSCIVATSEPHAVLMTRVSQILQESKLSLWPRSSDHENVGRIGRLLYSLQDIDVSRLKSILTSLT